MRLAESRRTRRVCLGRVGAGVRGGTGGTRLALVIDDAFIRVAENGHALCIRSSGLQSLGALRARRTRDALVIDHVLVRFALGTLRGLVLAAIRLTRSPHKLLLAVIDAIVKGFVTAVAVRHRKRLHALFVITRGDGCGRVAFAAHSRRSRARLSATAVIRRVVLLSFAVFVFRVQPKRKFNPRSHRYRNVVRAAEHLVHDAPFHVPQSVAHVLGDERGSDVSRPAASIEPQQVERRTPRRERNVSHRARKRGPERGCYYTRRMIVCFFFFSSKILLSRGNGRRVRFHRSVSRLAAHSQSASEHQRRHRVTSLHRSRHGGDDARARHQTSNNSSGDGSHNPGGGSRRSLRPQNVRVVVDVIHAPVPRPQPRRRSRQ